MGFFDSVIAGDKSSASGTQSSGAQAAATVATPSVETAPAADNDFLIIDETINVGNVPDTVAPSASDSVSFAEAPAAETSAEVSATSAVSFGDDGADLLIIAETAATAAPMAEAAPAEALLMNETVSFEASAPVEAVSASSEVSDLAVSASDEVAPIVSETATVAETAPAVEEVVPTSSFLDFSSVTETASATVAETAPVVEETAPAAYFVAETAAPVSASLDPETILASTIEQLRSVVSAKESARDLEMQQNGSILAELAAKEEEFKNLKAELKKRAAEAQDRAREIDASADRARSMIANLESQLQKAA